MEELDRFCEQLHEWSLSGKEPLLASKDLRFFDLQDKRLKNSGMIYTNRFDSFGLIYRKGLYGDKIRKKGFRILIDPE